MFMLDVRDPLKRSRPFCVGVQDEEIPRESLTIRPCRVNWIKALDARLCDRPSFLAICFWVVDGSSWRREITAMALVNIGRYARVMRDTPLFLGFFIGEALLCLA